MATANRGLSEMALKATAHIGVNAMFIPKIFHPPTVVP
jgi:hypothetical protein